MTAVILAGGESRRMGRDKAFLPLFGRPVIEWILGTVRPLFSRIIIVANKLELYSGYGAAVVRDALEIRGPLTGIYTALSVSEDEYNFVFGCDMPFLNPELISYMQRQANGFDAVVPMVRGLAEPLHAIYHKRLAHVMNDRLMLDERRIQSIFEAADIRYITEEEIDRIDPEKRSFVNLNTPEEYKEATCSDSGCRN